MAEGSPTIRERPGLPVQRIGPTRGLRFIDPAEIWRYRELLYFLVWRDVKIRYKQTLLGVAWAILQPLGTMLVFAVVFGRFARLGERTEGVPYSVWVFAGLLLWTFFANSITYSSGALLASSQLVSKVYFPRIIIPLAGIGVALVDLAVSAPLLLVLLAWHGIGFSLQMAMGLLPVVVVVVTAVGVGCGLSALAVAYRDFRHAVPFLMQTWLFLTPVIYPSSILPDRWRLLLAANPLAGAVESLRDFLFASTLDVQRLVLSAAVAFALFFAGVLYFRSVESRFADVI